MNRKVKDWKLLNKMALSLGHVAGSEEPATLDLRDLRVMSSRPHPGCRDYIN